MRHLFLGGDSFFLFEVFWIFFEVYGLGLSLVFFCFFFGVWFFDV